jgi:hypothetical protein
MFDKELIRSILLQIHEALEKIQRRSEKAESSAFFTDSSEGMVDNTVKSGRRNMRGNVLFCVELYGD